MKNLKSQKGTSILSLMIFMGIGLVVIAANSNLYLNVHSQVYGPNGIKKTTANYKTSGKVLLQSQMLLKGAGYAVEGIDANTSFVAFENAIVSSSFLTGGSFSTSGTKLVLDETKKNANLVMWETNYALSTDKNNYECYGLYSDLATNSLYRLHSATSCNDIYTNYESGQWTYKKIAEGLNSPINFVISKSTNCAPLGYIPENISGIPEIKGGLLISVNYKSSEGVNQKYDVCAINFATVL